MAGIKLFEQNWCSSSPEMDKRSKSWGDAHKFNLAQTLHYIYPPARKEILNASNSYFINSKNNAIINI